MQEAVAIPKKQRQRSSNWYLRGESVGTLKRTAHCLKYGENKVGKARGMDVRLPSRKASQFHCTLTVSDNEVILRDRSTNGTYVNHSKYHKSRQILGDGDLIAFGQRTFKYDKDDHSVLVFRLKHQEKIDETIQLSDDDGEPFNILPVKSEIKEENETEDVRSIDSYGSHATENTIAPGNKIGGDDDDDDDDGGGGGDDYLDDTCGGEDDCFEEPDEAHDWQRAEMFMDRLDFGQSNDVNETVVLVTTARPMPPLPLVPLNFIPNIDLPDVIPITAKIKEEICWNSHEYEKSLHPIVAEPPVTDTIDLCSDDDDASCSNAPNEPTDATTSQRLHKKHKPMKDEYEIKLPEIDAKRLRIDQNKTTSAKKMHIELPESEKNRLIDAVQLNPECLKVKAHVVSHSRGNRLALDMLGVDIDKSAAGSIGKQKPPLQSQLSHNFKEKPVVPSLEDDEAYPCKWSAFKYANQLFSEITGWDVQWLLDQKSDAPVCDEGFRPLPIATDFKSVRAYQNVWSNLAKIELWDQALSIHRRENANRAVFPYLTDVKYVKRHDDSARFIFFCEAEIEGKDARSRLYEDYLVLVVHGGGKFLAIITSVKCAKENDKLKLKFQMEAIKLPANEKISSEKMGRPKLISVKSIVNIRIELELFDALMHVVESPLSKVILHPIAHAKSLMDPVYQMEETQDNIVTCLYKRCIQSVLAQREAIYLIEGGPGTGKSIILMNTLIAMILNEDLQSKRILFCGATNASVDQFAYRFMMNKYTNEFVRFGILETIHPSLKKVSIGSHDSSDAERQAISDARLVFTNTHLASSLLKVSPKHFDVCIMDEASTCTELMVLPLLRFNCKVLVLAGDKHFKDAPITSTMCRQMNFGRSLFNRIIDSYGTAGTSYYPTLSTQYRMHPEISYWPNKQFYAQKMKSSKVSMDLNDRHFPLQPYTVFSFQQDFKEANVIEDLLSICAPHVDPAEFTYGIIPAFAHTRNILEKKVRETKGFPQIDISGYDCFQGAEKDVVIITAIKTSNFGFLNSPQNLNMALTRARRSLIFCGNFESVRNVPVWKSFLDDAIERGRLFYVDCKNTDFISKLLK